MELQNKWNSETANKFYLRRKVSEILFQIFVHVQYYIFNKLFIKVPNLFTHFN